MDPARPKPKRIPVKQLLQLQYRITQALAEAGSAQDVLGRILVLLGDELEWQRAELWVVDSEAGRIGLEGTWPSDSVAESEATPRALARGKGLAGRCWSRGKPFWARAESAFALPLPAGSETLGALLFFLAPSARPGRSLQNFLANLASQLGQFLRQARAEEEARTLAIQLLYSQEEERRRIARRLHESTAQNLAALKLHLAQLQGEENNLSPDAGKALQEGLALLEKTLQDIRTLAYGLRPPELDELGLGQALDSYVKGFSRRSGIQVELKLPPNLDPLPRDLRTALFRIIQESLTNVHQHAGSSHARIEVLRNDQQITLQVLDFGRGTPERTPHGQHLAVTAMGVGTAGMRERARQLGGDLEITSSGQGTTVRAVLPLRN